MPKNHPQIHPLPQPLCPMLMSAGSLTRRLSKQYGKIEVEVVFEDYRQLSLLEWQQYCRLAGRSVKKTQLFWVREIFLRSKTQKLIKAKTLLPAPQLSGKLNRLKHLGNTPIGYVLFKKHQTLPFVRQFIVQDGHFARQSLYDWCGSFVFVEECWLAD